MEFRTYFVYFHTFSETQSLMGRLWKYGSRLADHISVFPVVMNFATTTINHFQMALFNGSLLF